LLINNNFIIVMNNKESEADDPDEGVGA